jgi:hypothetical protein
MELSGSYLLLAGRRLRARLIDVARAHRVDELLVLRTDLVMSRHTKVDTREER